MKFLRLSPASGSGTDVIVNIDHIKVVIENDERTVIVFDSNAIGEISGVEVGETVEEIMAMIYGTAN